MPPPASGEEQLNRSTSTPEIRAAYRKRRAFCIALAISWILYGVVILWTDWLPARLVSWFLFAGVAVFGITGIIVWRCPACGSLLGRSFGHERCPACHMAFVEDRDRAA
jgi:hypothetical protein